MLEKIHDILHFWFGSNEFELAERTSQWFRPDPNFDSSIKTLFESTLDKASKGELEVWLNQPKSCLAYILLLDQFPRNIYRNTPNAFAYDAQALKACHAGLEQEWEKELTLTERQFFYMPLMHSEHLEDQKLSVVLFKKMVDEALLIDEERVGSMKQAYHFAIQHYETILQFGRFPHRNEILCRASTEAEENYLVTHKGW